MLIGQRIKHIRIQQGMTIDDLALKLGKNKTTIYRYENGDIENLPLGILDSLAEALNTAPAYLMGWNTDGTFTCTNHTELKYIERWHKEFGLKCFSNEEYEQIIDFGRYLIWKRTN